MPGAPRSGTPRESQAKFRDGIRFIEKPGVQDEGGHYVAKRSSDPLPPPPVSYTGVKVQVRDLVRIMGIVDPFAPRGVGTLGKFVSSSSRR